MNFLTSQHTPEHTPHSELAPPVEQGGVVTDAFCEHLLKVARVRGWRFGLRGEELEDCALGFLAHMLQVRRSALDPRRYGGRFEAWLVRCADHWILNLLRATWRLRRRELPWPHAPDCDGQTSARALASFEPGPEWWLLQAELARHICSAVGQLRARQRDLFVRFYVHDEPVGQIASSSGRSPGAIRYALWLLRRRLRLLLEQQGLDEQEARDYLLVLASGPPTSGLPSSGRPGTGQRRLGIEPQSPLSGAIRPCGPASPGPMTWTRTGVA